MTAPLPRDELAFRRAAGVTVHTTPQVEDALERLQLNPLACPRLPWDALHDLLGPLWPEQFWVVAASTGNGKSTFLMQVIDEWARAGRRVFMLPLEQPVEVMRTYWAALASDLDPRRVLENDWPHLPVGARSRVQAHLRWQQDAKGGRFTVAFSDQPFIGEPEIVTAFESAKKFGADVLVIDHLHRILIEGHPHSALVRICQRLKEGAKHFKIPVLCAAQLHRGDGDILAPYLPPKPTAIQGGEVVRQESDVALGLYRPLIETFTVEDARAIRMGQAKIRNFLEPNRIGVHVLKHRVRGGEAMSEVLKLTYRHGKIICPQTVDRLAYERREDL